MEYAIIGGDRRYAELFRQIGPGRASAFALEQAEGLPCAAALRDAVSGAACVILPMPACRGDGLLHTPLSERVLRVEEVLTAIAPGTLVCGGKLDAQTIYLAEKQKLTLVDYLQREDFAVLNAAATAEAALGLLLQNRTETLWNSPVLITGFGRIGKLLARRLRELGAQVAVAARAPGDRAWCRALGYTALDYAALNEQMGAFPLLVNTVPVPVLDRALLSALPRGSLVLDLASAPGGLTPDAAEGLDLRVLRAPGLPGKAVPRSAAAIILETVENIREEIR